MSVPKENTSDTYFMDNFKQTPLTNEEVNEIKKYKKLVIGNWFNHSINKLPNWIGLESIDFGHLFDKPVNNLPKNLKHAEFGTEFCHPVDKLPKGLQLLVLPKNYDKPTDHVSDLLQHKRVKY